jgi:hypothetical protein
MKNIIKLIIVLTIAIAIISCEATKPNPTVDSVVVTPNPVNVNRGQTRQFVATVNGSNNPSQSVSWWVGEPGPGTSITANGLLTVGASEPSNQLTIWVRSNFDHDVWGSATVNISGGIITGLSINPKFVNVAVGTQQVFTSTITGQNNPPNTVRWSVENNNSVSTTINTSGRLSIAPNETATTITVTATSTYDSSKSDTATVTVATIGNTYNVTNVDEWNQAITGIRNGGNNRIHVINVNGDVSIPPGNWDLFGSVIGLQVTLDGGGSLHKSGNGALVGVLGGQTLIAKNITLNGMYSDTTSPVVSVNRGVFIMENGSVVQNGGYSGIWIDSGSVIMYGGTIKNNRTPDIIFTATHGAGINAYNGSSITMHGNAQISHNEVGRYGAGGGIWLDSASSLTMEGGIITSNISIPVNSQHNLGGGVAINTNSRFTMNNGEISNNSSTWHTGHGGGVSLNTQTSSFVMNGGVIRGNTANGNGGAVHIRSGATFTMHGGTIANNNANRGAGVYTDWGNFIKTGGTITGNTATVQGNTAFNSRNPNLWRNANAGPNVNTTDYGFWLND